MKCLLHTFISAILLAAAACPATAGAWPYRDQLRSDIRFWKDIFTKYNDSTIVLHDPHDLTVVYTTLSTSPRDSADQCEQRIQAAKSDLARSLHGLADGMAAGRRLSKRETKLRRLFAPSATPGHIRACASRIRAQKGIANRFYEGLQRSGAYLPAIKKIFRGHGLPEELAYLPHVESSFDLTARSKAGAAGMWQFMRRTARAYHLKINAVTDERFDPLASSDAAARLLKANYAKLADWGLALTAYNYGLGGMAEAARRCGGDYLGVRSKHRHPRFGFASKNFYPEFLAAVEIMQQPAAYFPGYAPESRTAIVQHRLQKPAALPALAKKLGLELAGLRELNPGFTGRAWAGRVRLPAGYSVNIPAGPAARPALTASAKPAPSPTAAMKQAAARGIPGPRPGAGIAAGSAPRHAQARQPVQKPAQAASAGRLCRETLRGDIARAVAVRRGAIRIFGDETLGHIAQWLKLPPRALCSLNGIKASHSLRQRQRLALDFSRVTEAAFVQARLAHHISVVEAMLHKHNLDELIQYRLCESDSLQRLASRQFNIPASLIVYFNAGRNLSSLPPGATIRIPVSREAAQHIL